MSWKTFTPPVRMPNGHGVQTNIPGLGSSGPQEFGTPRPSNLKVKVIHKEKLSTLQHSPSHQGGIVPKLGPDVTVSSAHTSSSSGSSTGRTDTIPTAHVSPHPTAHTSSTYHSRHSLPRRSTDATATAALRRAVSTNDFNDIRFRSSSPPTVDNYQKVDVGAGSAHTRRWNSYQNLQEKTQYDFQELCADPDPTLSESVFPDPDEVNGSYAASKQRSQSHLSLTATGSNGLPLSAKPPVSATTDSMHYGGYSSVSKDLYGHHSSVRNAGSTLEDIRHGTPIGAHVTTSYGPDRSALMNYGTSTYNGSVPRHSPGFGTPASHLSSTAPPGSYSHPVVPSDVHYRHDVPSPSSDNFSSDITLWQQRHQEQLRRQHYEATQPTTTHQPVLTNGTTPMSGLTSLLDPHKLDAVKRAADSIIREKDNIIEKQKVKIVHMERQSKESESDLHKAMFLKGQEENDALHFKLQEVQYECASLKAQLTEVMSNKGSTVVDLERQLGKTEYELREVRTSSDKDRQSRASELKALQDMLSAKDKVLNEWKDKYMTQKSEYEALERKMDSFDRYLTDLPTADDHSKKSSEVRQLREDKEKYKNRSVEFARRLEVANKAARQKQEQLDEMEQADAHHQERIQQLETEISRLREELGLGEGEEAPLGMREELEQVRYENQRLTADHEKARKLLEAKHKKQQAIEVRHRADAKALEERLAQEENTVAGLREEMLNKEQHLKKLRASVKEIGSQNQDLLEKNMSLEEAQRELERQLTGEAHKLEQRLLKEMAVCFAELQSLVQICVQRAEGQDPNISVLLGVKGVMNLDPDDAQPVGDNIQSLKYKVSKIHELRQDIDNLREVISNKYAEDMGENLNCTTQ